MPWKVKTMSQQRLAFVQLVDGLGYPVAAACREFGVSRKTAYKWLQRSRADPHAPLVDHSRRPHHSPNKISRRIERQIVAARDHYRWGARKLRAVLSQRGVPMPSIRTTSGPTQHTEAPRAANSPPVSVMAWDRSDIKGRRIEFTDRV